ncbi:MAG: metallophosphoesterase [Pseudomonadota bacterium]
MSGGVGQDPLLPALEARVGRLHARLRLGIEAEHTAQVFGQGRTFFHIENWYSIHGLMRGLLRLTGLHGRGRRNARDIRLVRHEVRLSRLPAAFDGFRLLHLSDPHFDMHEDMPHAIAEAVRRVECDACVITGDFRARTFGPDEGALAGLKRLRAQLPDPVFAVLGNHDSLHMLPGIEALGIRVLVNESVALERQGAWLHFVGVDDPHYYALDNLEKALATVPLEECAVLLAHSAEIYRQAAHAGMDLMLCGHTHGGQIALPGGIPILCNARAPRRLCKGAWRHQGMQGYTSRGIGVSVLDVRLNSPPEMTLHVLKSA